MKKILALLAVILPLTAFAQDDVFVSKEAKGRGILLEELTGVNCGYCPAAHKIEADLLDMYPEQFFAVNIHAGGYATPSGGDPDMRTPDGNNLNNWYNPDGYPSGGINRHKSNGSYTSSYSTWKTQVAQLVDEISYVNLAVKAKLDWETRKVTFTAQEYFTGDPKEGCIALYLHIAMIQDGIVAHQSDYGNYNPDQFISGDRYRHLHVLRDYLTDVNAGEPVTDIAKDALLEQTFEYELPEAITDIDLDFANIHFVVFLTEGQKADVVTACEAKIQHVNAPGRFIEITKLESDYSLSCEPSAKISLRVKNQIGAPINNITFNFTTGAGTEQLTYTFAEPLPEGESMVITPGNVTLAKANQEEKITLTIAKVDGEEFAGETELSCTALQNLAYVSHNVVMDIVQDRYGDDITWELFDAEGTQVDNGGPYSKLSSSGTKVNSVPMNLEGACYTFTIHDKSGDGINTNFGKGYLAIRDAEVEEYEYYRHDGKYGRGMTLMLNTSAEPEISANEAEKTITSAVLLPNPAREVSVLRFELAKAAKLNVTVVDKNGAVVMNLGSMKASAGRNEISIPVKGLATGMYFVNLNGQRVNYTAKLTVVR